jgi:hypothetical protein
MPTTTIICGAILIVIGLAGYIAAVSRDNASWTALIPAIIGAILAILGLLAARSEGMRKHLMHAAVATAFLGFIATFGRLVSRISDLQLNPASMSQMATALVCLVLVLLGVRSFAAARAARV